MKRIRSKISKLLRKSNTFSMLCLFFFFVLFSHLQAFQVQYLMWTCVDNISIHVLSRCQCAHMLFEMKPTFAYKFIIIMRFYEFCMAVECKITQLAFWKYDWWRYETRVGRRKLNCYMFFYHFFLFTHFVVLFD